MAHFSGQVDKNKKDVKVGPGFTNNGTSFPFPPKAPVITSFPSISSHVIFGSSYFSLALPSTNPQSREYNELDNERWAAQGISARRHVDKGRVTVDRFLMGISLENT